MIQGILSEKPKPTKRARNEPENRRRGDGAGVRDRIGENWGRSAEVDDL